MYYFDSTASWVTPQALALATTHLGFIHNRATSQGVGARISHSIGFPMTRPSAGAESSQLCVCRCQKQNLNGKQTRFTISPLPMSYYSDSQFPPFYMSPKHAALTFLTTSILPQNFSTSQNDLPRKFKMFE